MSSSSKYAFSYQPSPEEQAAESIRRAVEACSSTLAGFPRGCTDECKLAKVAQKLSQLAAVKRACDVVPRLPYEERSVLLHSDPSVWLLCWRPEDDTTIHDHDDSTAGVVVVEGIIKEELFVFKRGTTTTNGKAFDVFVSERLFHPGSLLSIPAPYIHRFTSPRGLATTLHVYSPRLRKQAYFKAVSDGDQLVKTGEDEW